MKRKMQDGTNQSHQNAFRAAEKMYSIQKYKHYKHTFTDWTDVIDFMNIESNTTENQQKIIRVSGQDEKLQIYSLKGWEEIGFYVICTALSEEEQWMLVEKCLTQWPLPEHISNLNLHHGSVGKRIVDYFTNSSTSTASEDLQLAQKLRWITLGYQYDWTNRCYKKEHYVPFPEELHKMARIWISKVDTKYKDFNAEAAIVNFYTSDSTLCGHLDDAEETMDVPIISISLGNSAVFLLGGTTKEHTPIAMYLHSGDIMIMGGKSRRCYHGVPRIIENSIPKHLQCIESKRNSKIVEFLQNVRINLNIRQVYNITSSSANDISIMC